MPVPNQIAWRSILANGAVVFVYKLRENLDIGVGAGLTNSFGVPMILPMGYLNWRTSGKYEIRVDMSSGLKVTAAKWLNRKFKLELTAIEMDGISSVMLNRRKVQNLLLDNDAFDLVANVLHLPESECLFWDRRKLVAFDTNLGSRFRRISRQFPRGWP